MNTKQRINYIDIAKGIAMILVILGHTKKLMPVTAVWWLYTFHMPLFFMLSGMVFNPDKYKNFKEMFVAKFKSLIIPYFSLNLIAWFWTMIIDRPTSFLKEKTLNKFIGLFLGDRGDKYYFSMWFITALFLSEILLYVLAKAIKNRTCFFAFGFIGSAIAGYLIIKSIDNGFYWSADLVPTAISFVIAGYFLKVYREKTEFKLYQNILIMVVMLVVNVFAGYMNYKNNGRADLYELNMGNPIYYYISALSGSCVVILFCKLLKKCAVLEYIGRNSLIYYAFQKSLFINPLLVIVKTLSGLGGLLENKYVQLIIVVVATCVGLAIVSEAITKCFPFILGKFKTQKREVKEST